MTAPATITPEMRRELLAAWDAAVFVHRISNDACVNPELSDAQKDAIRRASTSASITAVNALGGFVNGFDGPAAIGLGWA